jgi:Ras GTPase-activating-like protein IQGAP2/3
MDRSNSVSSNPSTGSRSGSSAPFAYQTRLLERTSSRHGSGGGPLSRSNSQSNINILTNTTGSSVGSVTPTRWSSVHRVGNSLDLVRAKWEERSRELSDDTPSSSPTKDTSKSNVTNLPLLWE